LETIAGANNWKLVICRETDGITLLQAVTCDEKAALPAQLFGLPVRKLAHHALAPNRSAPEGEQVRITCGPEGEWTNSNLRELRLPDTLVQAGDYAFYNCTRLQKLYLHDGLRHWGGSALMNCRLLDTFHLNCSGHEGEVLSSLAEDMARELDVTLSYPDGRTARLIFPEYVEVYEENVPHHQFDFRIQGGGYPYHHCFYQRQFSLREYDKLWRAYLGTGHDEDCAMRLAWWRLRYPLELSDSAGEDYLDYLRQHVEEIMGWLLSQRDSEGMAFLLKLLQVERDTLSAACETARETEQAETVAILLEEQHRRFPAGLDKTFDL